MKILLRVAAVCLILLGILLSLQANTAKENLKGNSVSFRIPSNDGGFTEIDSGTIGGSSEMAAEADSMGTYGIVTIGLGVVMLIGSAFIKTDD